MTQQKSFDIIVLGLGVMGAATASAAARRGLRVLALDQFNVPNTRGSSHGDTRAIRQCYFEHPHYVPLLQHAFHGWRELETRTQRSLFHANGVLHIGDPAGQMIRECNTVAQ